MTISAIKARFRADPDRVWCSVHRGLWGPLPENSLAAIRAATRYEVVEVDLQLDAEGRPFLMHDEMLTRTTGYSAASSGASPGMLDQLRLRKGAGGDTAPITDERIPRLEDAFAALDGTDAIFDLDVKHARDVPAVAEAVSSLGGAGRATLKVDVLTQTDIASLRALEDAHGIMVMAKMFLRGPDDLALLHQVREADIAAAEVWFADLDILAEACNRSKPTLRIGVYTLDPVHCCGLHDAKAKDDPDAIWGPLVRAGVGQIMTDRAEHFADWLAQTTRVTP